MVLDDHLVVQAMHEKSKGMTCLTRQKYAKPQLTKNDQIILTGDLKTESSPSVITKPSTSELSPSMLDLP